MNAEKIESTSRRSNVSQFPKQSNFTPTDTKQSFKKYDTLLKSSSNLSNEFVMDYMQANTVNVEREVEDSVKLRYNKDNDKNTSELREGEDMDKTNWETKYLDGLERNQSNIREDMKSSEERISRLIEDSNQRIEGLVGEIKENNIRLESKFDTLQKEVKEDVKYNKNFSIATLLSLVAILITFIIGMVQIIIAIKGL